LLLHFVQKDFFQIIGSSHHNSFGVIVGATVGKDKFDIIREFFPKENKLGPEAKISFKDNQISTFYGGVFALPNLVFNG